MLLTWFSIASILVTASWQDVHREALSAMHDGRYAQAASLFDSAIRKAEHDQISAVWIGRLKNNHASALYQAGIYQRAEAEYLAALDAWESSPDASRVERAKAHNNLAVLYRQWWRLDDAEKQVRHALELDRAAIFWHTLAETLRLEGRYSESLSALDSAEAAGPDPYELGTILQARASVAVDQHRLDLAEPLYRQAVAELLKVFPPAHPSVLAAKGNLGVVLSAAKRDKEAESLLVAVYRDARTAMGASHPRVAASANNLAQLYRSQKRYAEADTLYREAISIWRAKFGEVHPEYAKGLHNLGSLFVEEGKLNGAEKLYRQAMEIAEANFGKQHAQTMLHASGLEQVYRLQKRNSELERLRKSFR